MTDAPTAPRTTRPGTPGAGGHRLRVLVLFGGRSAEHGVSCLSAASVTRALLAAGHETVLVGITGQGRWTLLDAVPPAPEADVPRVGEDGDTVALVATRKGPRLVRFSDNGDADDLGAVDVAFPVLHGPYGEDGTVQGMLASAGVPYVGSGVAASAVGIDKRQMKNVFSARGLPQVRYEVVRVDDWREDRAACLDRVERLGYPMFTKPHRQGSSLGITRCRDRDDIVAGLAEAYTYDRIAVVEEGLEHARELECGVLGNDEADVAGPGEVVTTGLDFYDFAGKYLDGEDSRLRCPADVPDDVAAACRTMAVRAYRAIGARGMARVDFFYLADTGSLLVNEINTIPGFTAASMYPFVWRESGLDTPALVDRLLRLALDAARTDDRYTP